MMEIGPKQQSGDIFPITFHNNDPLNDQLEITGKQLVALQPYYQLHSVVYTVSYPNSSTTFNLLIQIRQNRVWGMNVMNDGKWIF